MPSPPPRPTLAIGPVFPGWGSWEWVGNSLLGGLAQTFRTSSFAPWEIPQVDAVIVIKHAPPFEWTRAVAQRSSILYCPIDYYGDPTEILADEQWLRLCSAVVVHCRRLVPYFEPFATTAYIDHDLKYIAALRRSFRSDGRFLWVGVRTNLAPLVEWINAHPLPAPLDVLTNPERPGEVPAPGALGFRPDREVDVFEWTQSRHVEFTAKARAALEVKGDDFRSRHKPPAKVLDFVASGLPVALSPGCSAAEHLARLGLVAPSPLEFDRWLSKEYWQETHRCGRRMLRELSLARVATRAARLIEAAIAKRRGASDSRARLALPVSPTVLEGSSDDRTPVAETPGGSQLSPGMNSRLRPEDLSEQRYAEASRLLASDRETDAVALLTELVGSGSSVRQRALACNDLAALAARRGALEDAWKGFETARAIDPACEAAKSNLAALATLMARPAALPATQEARALTSTQSASEPPVRVAILSLLFNWPSTGGGTVHTAELGRFLANAGYDVRHFFARFDPWRVGQVTSPTPYPAEPLVFSEPEWTSESIVRRFREAVNGFDPDYVIISDSWNSKPLLAEAVESRRYILRLQALECLCPLNNVRLLLGEDGQPRQCPAHQLATPDVCARCVSQRGNLSGDLHRAERLLSGVGTPDYPRRLAKAFADAHAVLVVNPLAEAMVSPYTRAVHVVTAGMDPARFPWPSNDLSPKRPSGKMQILFAGLACEWMKGFHVIHAACERLWESRRDFELIVTDERPAGQAPDAFTHFVGWHSQHELPQYIRAADILVMPTVAQEALGRTAVEAMAAGRPVVASRLGGLLFTVADGATGLLFEPGNAVDLARKLTILLDDPELRDRLGRAGRQRFEEHYSWPVIVERHYRPLLRPVRRVSRGC